MSDEPVTDSPKSQKPVLLMVDDSLLNIEMVRSVLEPLGYQVVGTQNSRQALNLAREVKPKLILCDMRMPGPDGFTILAMIKTQEEFRSVPFIFVSATIWSEAERKLGRGLGATRFMSYPISPARLISEVESCLHREH